MFDFMLDAAQKIRQVSHETIGDKLSVGGEVSLLGMGTVFAVLVIIWGMVELLHLLLGDKSAKKAKKKKIITEVISESTEATVEPDKVNGELSTTPDYDIIAVITAAIAAASGSSPNSFRVVSFKRANNKFSAGK